MNSKERVPNVRCLIPAASYGQRWALCSNNPAKHLWSGWKWQQGYKEIASPFTYCSVNREYSWKKSQIGKNKNKNKKCKLCFTTCKNRLSVHVDEERLESFMTEVPYIQKTSPFIYRTNQWTGFYTIRASIMKELMLCYLHAFIEIHSLIVTKNWHLCIQISKEDTFN